MSRKQFIAVIFFDVFCTATGTFWGVIANDTGDPTAMISSIVLLTMGILCTLALLHFVL